MDKEPYIPQAVGDLASSLAECGFEIEAEPPSRSFGSQLLMFRDGMIAIRAVNDRGLWAVEIAAPGMVKWYDGDVWAACLDATEAPAEPRDLSEQVRIVCERLDDIRRALSEREPGELERCLFARHKDRFMRRMGRPESDIFAAE